MKLPGISIQGSGSDHNILTARNVEILVDGKPLWGVTKAVVSVDWNEGGLVMAELTLWLSNVRIDGAHGTLIGEHDGKTYELTEVEQT